MKRILLIGAACCLGLLIFISVTSMPQHAAQPPYPARSDEATPPPFSPDPRGVAMAKLMALNDFSGYLSGIKVVGDWSSVTPIDVRATASQLYASYSANEVAADDKFKGKSIAVTGEIYQISKNVFGSVYLVLNTGNEFASVHATLADESAAQAAHLSKGVKITLICTGDGMLLMSPILKDCQTSEVTLGIKRPTIEKMIDDLLAGEDGNLPKRTKALIGLSYVLGSLLPRGTDCETATPENMDACTVALRKVPKSDWTPAYLELSKRIPIPPPLKK